MYIQKFFSFLSTSGARKIILLFILLFFLPLFSHTQFYNGSQLFFGKNRVQYNDQFWSYLRYPDFNIYYTLNGKNLAVYAARYASEQIPKIENKLDYSLENNIQFVIFNKLSELKESNIGLISQEQYNTGGVTHIVGTKVFLYFNGDHTDFERQIRAGIAYVIMEQMLYGNNITSMIKNTTLLSLPDWYTQGLVSYISDEWNEETERYVIDGVLSGRYEKFNNLTGKDAVYAGHSIWSFIAGKYGETMIPNIIYMTKLSRNVESGFLFVLGLSFKSMIRDWINYYDKLYYEDNTKRELPDVNPLTSKLKKNRIYSSLRLCPGGNYAAWVSNDLGRYKVWIYDLNRQKAKAIMKHGYRSDEKTDVSFPLIAWHPSGKILSIIIEKKGKLLLYYYTLETKKFDRIRLFNFDKILDFAYSSDGRLIVLSGVNNGRSDIYIYNPASHSAEQITKDTWDDLNPRFLKGDKEIAFSSNRPGDTIVFENENHLAEVNALPSEHQTDIFIYDLKNKKNVLKRITNTINTNETNPLQFKNNYFTYLSNENGIYNRYIGKFDSTVAFIDTATHYRYFSTTFAATDFKRDIIDHDIDEVSGKTGLIIYHDGKYKLYVENSEDPVNINSLKLTKSPFYNIKKESLSLAAKKPAPSESQQSNKQAHKRLENVKQGEIITDSSHIDINNYNFGKTPSAEDLNKNKDTVNKKQEGIIQGIKTLYTGQFRLNKARNYDVEYTINQMVNQIDFSFLNNTYQAFSGGGGPIYINPGLNALFSIGIMDLLEDYRITGGVRLSGNLNNNEYFLSYENLKKRLDKQTVFHRKVILDESGNSLIKEYTHELHYVLKYPVDEAISLKGTAILRNDRRVFLSIDETNLKKPDLVRNWAGLKAEFTFDNTRAKGLNLYYGTRYKLFGEYYHNLESNKSDLYVLGLDYRNYTKIHKTFIWANRIAASTSFGTNKLIYYMGGVDNWLFPKFNTGTNIATDQNYAYQTLATNMRGFHQNVRNGNSFAVINSELRMPVFKYFSNKPIKSDFIENFQIIAFGDVGTAWTGPSPYSKSNSLYTQVIEVPTSIKITITTQKQPVVGGVGFGLRTRVLGYFLRADWAWGIEDGIVKPSVFYLSFSLDF